MIAKLAKSSILSKFELLKWLNENFGFDSSFMKRKSNIGSSTVNKEKSIVSRKRPELILNLICKFFDYQDELNNKLFSNLVVKFGNILEDFLLLIMNLLFVTTFEVTSNLNTPHKQLSKNLSNISGILSNHRIDQKSERKLFFIVMYSFNKSLQETNDEGEVIFIAIRSLVNVIKNPSEDNYGIFNFDDEKDLKNFMQIFDNFMNRVIGKLEYALSELDTKASLTHKYLSKLYTMSGNMIFELSPLYMEQKKSQGVLKNLMYLMKKALKLQCQHFQIKDFSVADIKIFIKALLAIPYRSFLINPHMNIITSTNKPKVKYYVDELEGLAQLFIDNDSKQANDKVSDKASDKASDKGKDQKKSSIQFYSDVIRYLLEIGEINHLKSKKEAEVKTSEIILNFLGNLISKNEKSHHKKIIILQSVKRSLKIYFDSAIGLNFCQEVMQMLLIFFCNLLETFTKNFINSEDVSLLINDILVHILQIILTFWKNYDWPKDEKLIISLENLTKLWCIIILLKYDDYLM